MWLKVSSLIHFAIFMFFVGYIYFFKTACPYFLWNWLKLSNVHELGERESQVLTQSQMNWSKASLLTRPYRFLSHRVTHWSRMSKKTSHKCISKVCTIHKRSSHQNRNLTVWKKNKINQINESTEEEKALQCCLTQDHAVFSHFSFPRYLPAWLLSSLISYKDDSNLKRPPLWFSKLNVEKTSNITTFTLVLYTVSSLPLSVPHPH